MQNFVYSNPTAILFGRGMIAQAGDRIPAKAQVLLVYGGGSIKRNGVYAQVVAALKPRRVVEFGGIEANHGGDDHGCPAGMCPDVGAGGG